MNFYRRSIVIPNGTFSLRFGFYQAGLAGFLDIHFRSNRRYFGVKSGPFMSIKYTLLFQILIFCMNLRGKFAYEMFFYSPSSTLIDHSSACSRYSFYVGEMRSSHSWQDIKCLQSWPKKVGLGIYRTQIRPHQVRDLISQVIMSVRHGFWLAYSEFWLGNNNGNHIGWEVLHASKSQILPA